MVRLASVVALACAAFASGSVNGTANVALARPVTLGGDDGFLEQELVTLFGNESHQAYEVRACCHANAAAHMK